jgi:hypothetical protein
VIGMSHSVHLQKWLSHIERDRFEIYFVESTTNDPNIDFLNSLGIRFRTKKLNKDTNNALNPKSLFSDNFFHLAYYLKNFKFELVHIFEIQHAGYLFLEVFDFLGKVKSFQIFLSVWGSDIFWFRRNKYHEIRITYLISLSDKIVVDSFRDAKILKEYNFFGDIIKINTHSGGLELYETIPSTELRLNDRNGILIKGNFGFVGRPFFSLDLLEKLNINRDFYHIHIISLPSMIHESFSDYLKVNNFNFSIYEPMSLARMSLFRIIRKSRITISTSLSDGLPTLAIESMANGSIPIQTSSSAIQEVSNSYSILFDYPIADPNLIEQIDRILYDDEFYENMAISNIDVANKNFLIDVIRNQINSQVYSF